MTIEDFPTTAPARPLWLVTLADLALLLVGFFVLLQANQQLDRRALARGLAAGFGVSIPDPAPVPVAAAAVSGFAPGSATLPANATAMIDWARDAARDPRVGLRITGNADGSHADTDPSTASGVVLAADRARAVAALLAAADVARGRMIIVTADPSAPPRRQVVVTLAFVGETRGKLQ